MTPADEQAHWFQELELALWGKLGNTWERNQLQRVEAFMDAILLRPDVQALEALRDGWLGEAGALGGEPYDDGYASALRICASELDDVLLHGAGGLQREEQKDDLARMDSNADSIDSRTASKD